MSALERPKSAGKSRSRTPHYTNWEVEPDRGRQIPVEPPPATSDSSNTVVRRETVLLTDASGSLKGKAGRQRRASETTTKPSAEVVDSEWATTKKNGRQKKKTVVQDSFDDLSKKFEDVSKTTMTQEEITRRNSTSVSDAEEIRRLPISTQRREKSWLKDGPFCDVRIMSKELREGGGGGDGGGPGGRGGVSRRLYTTAKPSKLAPLSLSRPSDGLEMQETSDPRSWVPERGPEYSLISVDMHGKRSDANRRSKLTPLPGLRKGSDTETQQDQHPYSND